MRIVEALRKRGITDLRTVSCNALPVAYRAVPEQATQRIGFGSCSRTHGTYHSWGRSIEGLTFLAADDPAQMIGAFSEHQFWVTPHNENERYASGTYPTSSDANDGLAVWTRANRSIANTDIVSWYTLGFHHITRAEDWPVMPTMWHQFQIRPFHFFEKNPVLVLPKSLTSQ